jgi:putative membrane protein
MIFNLKSRHNQKIDSTLKIYILIFFLALLWSGINPRDQFTWLLEVIPALVAFAILAFTYKKFRFTNFAYLLILIHSIILMVGGHTTYAEMPLFNWLRDTFDLARNYYDRLGHLAQGFIPALILREIVIRKNIINGRRWQFALIIMSILGASAFYEFFEWGISLVSGEAGNAFLGTQGDIWDTQWDMFMCLIGSIVSLLSLGKIHDKYLKNI